MRFSLYIFASLFLFATQLSAQEKSPLLNSLEFGYQNAIFDPAQGLTIKANHHWNEKEKSRLQSGIMLSGLLRGNVSPQTTGIQNEAYSAYRLNFHTGWVRYFGKKQKLYGILEGYVGLRGYQAAGSLDQASQGFSREYSDFTVRGDWGLRFGLGYQLTDKLALQSAVTASFIDVNHPLGFYTGILFWGPDVLSLVEVSLNYQFGE